MPESKGEQRLPSSLKEFGLPVSNANGGAHWGITERTEYCDRFVAQLPEVNNEEFWVSVGVAVQVLFYACLLIGYAKWHTLAASSGGV